MHVINRVLSYTDVEFVKRLRCKVQSEGEGKSVEC